jgi:hypothetical protein
MKKLFAGFILLLGIITAQSVSVLAAAPVDKFAITGGVDTSKSVEKTFDSTRIISGTAEKGAEIEITVYEQKTRVDGTTYLTVVNTYSLTVGSTGIFSQSVNLIEGKNYIVVAADKGDKHSQVSATINRKGGAIKSVLSQYIALPGQKSGW